MIAKRLEAISEQDIQSLIANSVSEGRTIEYKRELPGNSDAEKKEFLADVSSFANTSGGDVVYGVEEAKGVPIATAGLAISDLDQETRRLDSILADGLEPRIRYEVKAIPLAESRKVVLVIRVERSWVGPHRVTFKSHDKFYARNSAGKYSLDVPELRAAFALSQTTIERARSFRVERVMAIVDSRTPVPIEADARLVFHCVPLESFAGSKQADVARFYGRPDKIRSINGSGMGGGSTWTALSAVAETHRTNTPNCSDQELSRLSTAKPSTTHGTGRDSFPASRMNSESTTISPVAFSSLRKWE